MNFELRAYPNGARGTRKTLVASAQVDFGTAVYFASDGNVEETSAITDIPIGVALNDDMYESENEDTYYASGNPVTVALRGSGEVLRLVNVSGVSAGDQVAATAAGSVIKHASNGTNDYQIFGIGLGRCFQR